MLSGIFSIVGICGFAAAFSPAFGEAVVSGFDEIFGCCSFAVP